MTIESTKRQKNESNENNILLKEVFYCDVSCVLYMEKELGKEKKNKQNHWMCKKVYYLKRQA